ncbi:MAG: F0F1 ATP synthase subunit B [Lachnospiraceae bacterium]|nr:F0F1 ATP synthase subunit B [Lachnospiraceae bacterium]
MADILFRSGILLSSDAADWSRLFDLDFQLIQDAALMLVAVFFLFLILSYFLFNPARKMLDARKEKIAGELESAAKREKDAAALKAEYEAKLAQVNKEADEILADARKRAAAAEAKTLSDAREEAARIIAQARQEAELEKRKAADDVKTEIVQVATLMAEKLLEASIDNRKSEALLDETIAAMGKNTWLSR